MIPPLFQKKMASSAHSLTNFSSKNRLFDLEGDACGSHCVFMGISMSESGDTLFLLMKPSDFPLLTHFCRIAQVKKEEERCAVDSKHKTNSDCVSIS